MVSLRIAFFGTPAFAVPSLEALAASAHQVAIVVSQPDKPKGRGQQLQATPTKIVAIARGIPVVQPIKIRDQGFLDSLRRLDLDLGVVVAYGRLLPDALLAIPRLGMINVHASLLPRYRGAAPIQRAVISGDPETGVTIMRVASELDAGPTFSMRSVPIPGEATSGEMENVLSRLGAELLLPTVHALSEGRAVETPQDHRLATLAPKLSKSEGTIDWSSPASTIHNQIRGLQPWPLASTTLDGARLVIRRGQTGVRPGSDQGQTGVRPGSDPVGFDPGLTPGTIVRAGGDELIVACGDGTALRVLEIQPEGRRTMSAREFLAGRGVREGDRLGS